MHDTNGQQLNEGDHVAIPIGFGLLAVGQIVGISSGLVALGAPNQPAVPTITVALNINVPAHPNGVVPGLLKLQISGATP